jgi:G3E family GTPase
MTVQTTNPVPITILTGFLGAGKTTLLNQLLHADHGLRVAVLVNDFGAINIDSQLVVGVEGDGEMISLQNGCICCTIRTDLLKTAVDLLRRPEPPEYIIIETSGVGDPAQVASTFMLPEIRQLVRVDSILTVIDAEQARSLENELYFLAMEQIGVADIVVLNKIDLVDAAQRAELHTWIRSISEKSRIYETTYADVPPALLLGVGGYDPARLVGRTARDIHVHEAGEPSDHDHTHDGDHDHDHAHDGDHDHDHAHDGDHVHTDHSLVFETWNWTTDQPLSLKALRKVIENLPTTIYRAKGFVFLAEMPDNRGVLHVVGKRVSLTFGAPWGDDKPTSQIVAIGTYGGVDADALRAAFEGTWAINQPASELERVKNQVMEWLRWRK